GTRPACSPSSASASKSARITPSRSASRRRYSVDRHQAISPLLYRPHYARDSVSHLFPFRFFGLKLFPAGQREPVIFELALLVFGGSFPLRREPAFSLQPMQRGVQGPVFDLEHVIGGLLDVLGNLMSMGRAEQQRSQDQHVKRALKQLNSIAGFL